MRIFAVIIISLEQLSAVNAGEYLKSRAMGLDAPAISELGGGVSNTVLLVESGPRRLVIKQALGKLRVEQDWRADRRRIFRESAALRKLARYLPAGALPEVVFEDRENFIFVMTAAPAGAVCWKELLMRGEIRVETADRVGSMLASIATVSWRDPVWESEFGDQAVFDQLRIDPYYRAAARKHADLAAYAMRLIEESGGRRVSLTHGDWSPKNFLVDRNEVMAIDFEVIHFGDPAFDAAFLLNHLLLKSFYQPHWATLYEEAASGFWRAFLAGIPQEDWIEAATLQHLGWLMLARVDGKSPAEYLRDPKLQDRVRRFARELIVSPPRSVMEVFRRL